MTEEERATAEVNDDGTMGDVDHTHPHTNETFGAAFKRGPAVAADGGERDAEDETEAEETMADVDHEAPGEGVTRAYERGTEGRDETV
ncbi:hypothetical protein [Haloarcula nitratireducens]|uniref:Uncharacterized protein n=1 Tax=Haloarcula nitratireducens TaxID=2487749 RepID=A0AAW4P9J8_9EURY|nr:hypothetical protein [Halomicroarcula nitratireducens]MBX0294427.1 hypothetical protein [Halomicroarcula nitratireducens]